MSSFWAFLLLLLLLLNVLILRSVIPHLDITKCHTTISTTASSSVSFVMTDERGAVLIDSQHEHEHAPIRGV